MLTNATTNAVIPAVPPTMNPAGTRVTLNPNAALARNTLYRVPRRRPTAIRAATEVRHW